jgi:hypothetical protein
MGLESFRLDQVENIADSVITSAAWPDLDEAAAAKLDRDAVAIAVARAIESTTNTIEGYFSISNAA